MGICAASAGLTNVDISTDANYTFPEGIEYIDVHNAKADGFHFLLGASIVKFGDLWICGYGQSLVRENDTNTRFACKYSEDACKTWSEEYVIGGIEAEYCRSHGVFYNAGDTLYAYAPRAAFGHPTEDIHYPGLVMEAYRFDPADRSWTNLGVVLNDGFWPLGEPIEIRGDRLLMAGLDCKTGTEQAAVAVADKDNPLAWEMIIIPNASGIGLWGESTVIDYGDKYVLFCRTQQSKFAVSASTDGLNWSNLAYTDFAATKSKPYGGTLSDGRHYLIYGINSRAGQLITVGKAGGAYGFVKPYYIRSGFDTEPQFFKSKQWAYPYAVEDDGKLYVVYSEHKENCELAIIPIASLSTDTADGNLYHHAYASREELPERVVVAELPIDENWWSGDGLRNGDAGENIEVVEIDGIKAVAKTQVEAALTQSKKEQQVLRRSFEVDYTKVKKLSQLAFEITFWSAEDVSADRLTADMRLFFGNTAIKDGAVNLKDPSSYTINARVDYKATTEVGSEENLFGTVKRGWNTWLISFNKLSSTENYDSLNTFFMIMPNISGLYGKALFAISSLKIVEIPSATGADDRNFDLYAPGSIIIDDMDEGFAVTNGESGTEWAVGTGSGGYNTYSHSFAGPDASATAKWTFDVDESGEYIVYIWYRAGNARADAATVEIHSGENAQAVTLNQKVNGSMWFELGRFELDANAENYVLMRATDDNYQIADAIRVQKAWYKDAAALHAEIKTLVSDINDDNPPACFPVDMAGKLNAAHSALGDILVEETADKETVSNAIAAMNTVAAFRIHSFEAGGGGYNVCTVCGHRVKIGDVDGDGSVTLKDALELIRAVVNGQAVQNGDLSGDGKISLADVVRILKQIAQ